MTTATQATAAARDDNSVEQKFLPYAQLAKMLVPSSGCLSVYDADGELRWSSDGYERPDLREFVTQLARVRSDSGRTALRTSSTGTSAFTAALIADGGQRLGYLIVELQSERTQAHALSTHLLNPLVECLCERMLADSAPQEPRPSLGNSELEFLIGVAEIDATGTAGLRQLLDRCMETLNCVAAAFVSPDPSLTVIVQRDQDLDKNADVVERTRRHLLAWAQLNNRPMVVNRVGSSPGAAPFKILSCPVRSESNELTGLIALFRAATVQNFERRDVHLLEFLCRRVVGLLTPRSDPLAETGTVTRAALEAFMAGEAERAGYGLEPGTEAITPGGRDGALLQINIDRLQAVNDEYGLDAGDAVIRELAACLKRHLEPTAVAMRLSGDRFAVFLPGVTAAQAGNAADTLLEDIARSEVGYRDARIPLSVSIGIAVRDDSLADPGELIAAAGTAMEEARRDGGNRYAIYRSDSMGSPQNANASIAAAKLREALDASQFALLAQPIVALANPAVTAGYELLIRLPDSTGALLSPDRFMSVAERYRLMLGVDTWVFAEMLRSVEPFAETLGELPVGVAVNVSAQSLQSPNYLETIVAEIARSRLPGSAFSFEISEADALAHLDAAETFIDRIRGAGAKTALDGFGVGLSSFAQLRRLNVDYVKIGGELIRDMAHDRHLESTVLGLAKAAESLGIPTVAEQVENQALADKLAGMGLVYGQGFAFGRPAALSELLNRTDL